MVTLMLALLIFIVIRIKTKNMWGDLEKIERRIIKGLVAFCFLAGICRLKLK